MKSAYFILFALIGLFTTVLSSPVLQSRDDTVTLVTGIIQSLLTDVKTTDAGINSTGASITPSSTAADKLAAEASISEAINGLTSRITKATADITALKPLGKRALEERQTDLTGLAGLVYTLLVEISSTLDGVIATMGLGGLIGGSLGPLVTSLSALILALKLVVDNLLELVKELLDGLLTGLSAALAGLVI